MNLNLERDSDMPLYRQLTNQIRDRIRSGSMPPGTKLPPVRQLAKELGLTRLTVHNAYSELQSEGLVESYVGRGTYVADLPHQSNGKNIVTAQPPSSWVSQGLFGDLLRMAVQPDLVSFATSIPASETFPDREFGRILKGVLDECDVLAYGTAQGELVLREQVAYLLLDRGITTSPAQVLITSGAQQAIELALRSLVKPDEVVLVEEPTYPGFIELAQQRGQRVVGIPVDEGGILLEALETACATYHPRLLYSIPSYQNPNGSVLDLDRRKALLKLAVQYDLIIVEDDVYGFLNYCSPALPALKSMDEDGRVIYLNSFSKILAPGLRLGMVVADPDLFPILLSAKRNSDLGSSPVLQRAVAAFLLKGYMGLHMQNVRNLYRERCAAMLSALDRHMAGCLWSRPTGGLNIWLVLPEGINERDFHLAAVDRKIGVAPGRAFFLQPTRNAFIRLSFGAQPAETIERGIAVLGELLREQLKRRNMLVTQAGLNHGPLF